jgi:hypothetical protein
MDAPGMKNALALLVLLTLAAGGLEGGPLEWSGFAAVRGNNRAEVPLRADTASAQVQLGLDWSPSPAFAAHLHLLARTDDGDSEHGHAGTPEAFIDARFPTGAGRVRVRAGAFFLPTSRENVDALWENAYAVTSSALNTWFGEELRPIGVDVQWQRGGLLAGATGFFGNETLGELPLDPGWGLGDRWTVLGQKVASSRGFASVSTEHDGRPGWALRAGWNGPSFSLLFTRLDNRSDGLRHGDIRNWNTQQNVAGFDLTRGSWTVAAESGWGPTVLYRSAGTVEADLRASYLLLSRLFSRGRATVRIEEFTDGTTGDQALTLAGFWSVRPTLTLGAEISAGSAEARALGELRYRFGR